jgi:hypothetical protein
MTCKIRSRLQRSLPRAICLAILLVAAQPIPSFARNWLDFPRTTFNIYDANTRKLIGRGFYEIRHPKPGQALIYGENRYLDGEYDIEQDLLELQSPSDALPRMLTFSHTFFNPDGSNKLIGEANTITGQSQCSSLTSTRKEIRKETMEFPQDTFAGAALVVPIERALNLGLAGPIEIHVFDCTPTPRIVALKINTSPSNARWSEYPGKLVLADAVPDLGFLNFIAAPFLPKVQAWFDPSEDFLYIGGEIHRYLWGTDRIIVVKVPRPKEADTQPSAVKTPDAMTMSSAASHGVGAAPTSAATQTP